MKLQQLLSLTRKGIDEYKMIQDNDIIAVGISGGKDSLALLYALSELRRFYPKHFNIEAITVDLGLKMDFNKIAKLCKNLNINYTIVETQIAPIIFEERKENSPCSLCAKMRKGALNEKANELGCNKVAYAHHKDDIIETMLMSLIFEGRFHTFSPVTYLDQTKLTVIRPMLYIDEAQIKGFSNKYELPIVKNLCPADGYTKRQYVKDLIKNLSIENKDIKKRFFHAIVSSDLKGWKR